MGMKIRLLFIKSLLHGDEKSLVKVRETALEKFAAKPNIPKPVRGSLIDQNHETTVLDVFAYPYIRKINRFSY